MSEMIWNFKDNFGYAIFVVKILERKVRLNELYKNVMYINRTLRNIDISSDDTLLDKFVKISKCFSKQFLKTNNNCQYIGFVLNDFCITKATNKT